MPLLRRNNLGQIEEYGFGNMGAVIATSSGSEPGMRPTIPYVEPTTVTVQVEHVAKIIEFTSDDHFGMKLKFLTFPNIITARLGSYPTSAQVGDLIKISPNFLRPNTPMTMGMDALRTGAFSLGGTSGQDVNAADISRYNNGIPTYYSYPIPKEYFVKDFGPRMFVENQQKMFVRFSPPIGTTAIISQDEPTIAPRTSSLPVIVKPDYSEIPGTPEYFIKYGRTGPLVISHPPPPIPVSIPAPIISQPVSVPVVLNLAPVSEPIIINDKPEPKIINEVPVSVPVQVPIVVEKPKASGYNFNHPLAIYNLA
jgi:hypothetical protein